MYKRLEGCGICMYMYVYKFIYMYIRIRLEPTVCPVAEEPTCQVYICIYIMCIYIPI